MKNEKKGVGAFLGIGIAMLAIVSLILYMVYATSADGLFMPWVLALLLMIAFGCFLMDPPETIGSVVDYFQNIVMFGNPEKFGIIMVLTGILLLMTVIAVIACFMTRVKPAEA